MNLDFIKAHYPIFESWAKEDGIMPEGAALIEAWYRYAKAWSDYMDSLRVIVAPEPGEAADD